MLSFSRSVLIGVMVLLSGLVSDLFAGEILLKIRNVRNNDGHLLAALHNSENSFPYKGSALMYLKVKAVAGNMQIRFSVETPGKYAISMFHDENDNGILDTNLIGIPTEGYGFSNNARSAFGPPEFREALLPIDGGVIAQTIELTY